tara:strand:+ start:134 stop:340 length:207 start_codon:yes stop_codon:yes gene_type:complete
MPKYRIVLSYDVQKEFVVDAKDYEEAEEKAIEWQGDTGKDNWEYRDLIENENITQLQHIYQDQKANDS